MVRELRAAGRRVSRRSTSTPTRLWGNFEPSTPCAPSRAPTETQVTRGHLRVTWAGPGRKRGTKRGPRGALTWPGVARKGRRPGRLRQLPSRGSVNWLAAEARRASPPAGQLASAHAHPQATQASARARTHTYTRSHTRTHSHKACLPRDSASRARRAAAQATRRLLAPRPVPRPAPRPPLYLRPPLAPRAGPPRRGRSPRPAPGPPPAPSAVARNGAAPCAHPPGEAGEGSAAPAPRPPKIRAALRRGPSSRAPGSASRRWGRLLALWRAGRGGGGGGAEGEPGPRRGRQPPFFLRLLSFLPAPRSTSQQLPHPRLPPPGPLRHLA